MESMKTARLIGASLRQEEIRNEKHITYVRIFLFTLVLLLSTIARFSIKEADPLIVVRFRVIFSFCISALVLYFFVNHFYTKDRYFPLLKYILTLFDIIFVSVAIFILRHTSDSATFIMSTDTPAFFALFLINALSGLRLDIKHSLYCAVLTFIVFLLFTASDFHGIVRENPTLILASIIKGVFLVGTALISGYIGIRAKKLLIENLREQEEKNIVTKILGRYVSGPVAEKILDGNIELGGEEKKITVLFSDIKDFTWISEKLSPPEIVTFLNDYFEMMVEVIFKHHGILDKFTGDGIMAVFGAPESHGNDQMNTISAALEMNEMLKAFNRKQIKKEDVIIISTGIGISTGVAVVGNIGSADRMEYTAIGDTINIASRICDYSKEHGSGILVDEKTIKGIETVFTKERLKPLLVKGKKDPVTVYKIIQ